MRKNKLVMIFIFLPLLSFGNIFETNCLQCHTVNKQLEMFMSRYLLKYSSEKEVQKAIFLYLKNPKEETSIMPMGFLNRFGIKEKSTLSDNELKNAIWLYYKKFAPQARLQ
ncbi:MAG: hypothetical protein PHF17_10200 [Arcobacteraceae bacterium]|jgi:hypothetical protein|nr:hypothetical protein [Arcobacteraceae bacterium]